MKLVNMKLDKKAREATLAASPKEDDNAPRYPWGLSLTLDDETLEKLGIDLPKIDAALTLTAKVSVTNVSSNESAAGGKNRSVSLQITDMALDDAADGNAAAEKLYGGSKGGKG